MATKIMNGDGMPSHAGVKTEKAIPAKADVETQTVKIFSEIVVNATLVRPNCKKNTDIPIAKGADGHDSSDKTNRIFGEDVSRQAKPLEGNDRESKKREFHILKIMEQKGVSRDVAAAEYDFFY